MNIKELKEQLDRYPEDTHVATSIQNGYALLVNDIMGVMKDNKTKVVCLLHIPSGGYFDNNVIRLND